MRILHLTAPSMFGGLERVVSGLASETSRRAHQVVVVMALSPGDERPPWARPLQDAGVVVETLHLPPGRRRAEVHAIRALISAHRAQVIHAHGYRSDVLGLFAARATNVPIISTAHGFVRVGWKRRLYCRLQLLAWRRFDAVVAVSKPLESEIIASGVEASRVVRIENGFVRSTQVALERTLARARLGVSDARPVVGWVGRFSEEKAPDLMVRAVAAMRQPAQACLLGDGPMRGACESLAATMGVSDRVRLPGAVRDAETYFSAFDALVLSSRTEGTPMVILEALAAGVPVVATAVGGIPDLLDGTGNVLVPPGDAHALARAIDGVLSDLPAMRERSLATRDRLLSRAVEADWVDRYIALYRALS